MFIRQISNVKVKNLPQVVKNTEGCIGDILKRYPNIGKPLGLRSNKLMGDIFITTTGNSTTGEITHFYRVNPDKSLTWLKNKWFTRGEDFITKHTETPAQSNNGRDFYTSTTMTIYNSVKTPIQRETIKTKNIYTGTSLDSYSRHEIAHSISNLKTNYNMREITLPFGKKLGNGTTGMCVYETPEQKTSFLKFASRNQTFIS